MADLLQAQPDAPETPPTQEAHPEALSPAPSHPKAKGPSFQVYDKQGKPMEVPLSSVAQGLLSGEYKLPHGAPVPIKLSNGEVGTTPIEALRAHLEQGAQVVSHEEHAQAVKEAQYGDLLHQMETAGIGAAEGASMGLSSVAIRALGGKRAAEHVRALNEVNPGSRALGNVAGMTAGAFLAPEAEAVEGTEGAGMLSRAAQAFTAPSRLITHIGDATEAALTRSLPEEATGLAGRLLQSGLKQGVRAGAEGAGMGFGDYISEEALDPNPKLSGEKLWASVSHGAILAGLGGGALGVGGELGRDVLGRLAPRLKGLAGEQAFRALNPKLGDTRLAMKVPGLAEGTADELASKLGGPRAIGQELLDHGVIRPGDSIEQIAQRAEPAAREAGQAVDAIRTGLDTKGVPGLAVKDVLKGLDELAPKLNKLPSLNRGAISAMESLQEDLIGAVDKAAIPGLEARVEQARQAAFGVGLSPAEAEAQAMRLERKIIRDEGRFTFQQAADLRARIDDQINQTAPPLGVKSNVLNDTLKAFRSHFEDEMEKAVDRGTKDLGESALKAYQDAKLTYRKLALGNAIAQKSLAAKLSNRALSLTDYIAGGTGAIAGLASGHPLGAALAATSSLAHKIVRERGNATTAVMMDKLASLGAVRRAIAQTERETSRAVARAVGDESKVIPRLKVHIFQGNFKAQRDAVLQAAANADQHMSDLESASSPFSAHSPNVANAFHLTALRATMYLASQLPEPKDPAIEGLMPKLSKSDEPPLMEQMTYERKFNAVHDPISVLHGVSEGSVTQDEVQAIDATASEWLKDTRLQLRDRLAQLDEELPLPQAIALSKFLGEPVTPMMRPDFIAAIQNGHQNRPQPQTAPRPSKATPKTDELSFASASQLNIGGVTARERA